MPCADLGGMTSILFPNCFWRRAPRGRRGRSTPNGLRKNAYSSQMFARWKIQTVVKRSWASVAAKKVQRWDCLRSIRGESFGPDLWNPSGMGCSDKHPQECGQQGGSAAADLRDFVTSLSSRCTLHSTEPSSCLARKSNWPTMPWRVQCSTQTVPAFAR